MNATDVGSKKNAGISVMDFRALFLLFFAAMLPFARNGFVIRRGAAERYGLNLLYGYCLFLVLKSLSIFSFQSAVMGRLSRNAQMVSLITS